MNQNVPKPMFLGHFRLELVGALIFYFSRKHILTFCIYIKYISSPSRAQMERPWRAQMERPWGAHPGPRWSALAGPRAQGPWRPKADQMEAEGRPNGGLGAKPPEKNHVEKNQGGPHQDTNDTQTFRVNRDPIGRKGPLF